MSESDSFLVEFWSGYLFDHGMSESDEIKLARILEKTWELIGLKHEPEGDVMLSLDSALFDIMSKLFKYNVTNPNDVYKELKKWVDKNKELVENMYLGELATVDSSEKMIKMFVEYYINNFVTWM